MSPAYAATVEQIGEIATGGGRATERLQRVMEIIHRRHPRYEWVGVYVLRGKVLHLGPYVGAPTEHTQIPVGVGVCGTAVAERANQIIGDVRTIPNYLSCSPTVRSEIVVLVRQDDEILGQIDADCDEVGAFAGGDEAFLTEVAALIAPLVAELR